MVEALLKELEICEEDIAQERFVTFSKCKVAYGMEINYITKIIGLHDMIKITGLHKNVKGIINFRDRIIPVIDTKIGFIKELKAYNNRTCILIIEIQGNLIGIIVNNKNEVLNIDIAVNYLVMMNSIKIQ